MMITDLLGSPSPNQVCHLTSHAVIKDLLSHQKPPALHNLYNLSHDASHCAVHLLSQMLKFDPVRAICQLGLPFQSSLSLSPPPLSLSPFLRLSVYPVWMLSTIPTWKMGVFATTLTSAPVASQGLMVSTGSPLTWSHLLLCTSARSMRGSSTLSQQQRVGCVA